MKKSIKGILFLCFLLFIISCSNNVEKIDMGNGVFLEMVKIKAGSYMRGMPPKEIEMLNKKDRLAIFSEFKQHKVTLTKDFYMGKYEVTQAQWEAVMANNPSYFKGENLPVENVSWNDCHEFIEKLNRLTGKKFRLPTEAEWEYAARGGNKSKGYIYSGSNNVDEVAEYEGNNDKSTKPVGGRKPNELGIYDMSGNVWEWCQDWYEPYSTIHQTDPEGAKTGSGRVLRGGSCYYYDVHCRVAHRYYLRYYDPSARYSYVGFRLARTD
ncbi:MAG TPA: formylglycine-generating enzyme family protein [bacterium]|nr:formylglycine-generating enzyme family protein [bacterium]